MLADQSEVLLNDVLNHLFDGYETVIFLINMNNFMLMPHYLFFVDLLSRISDTFTYTFI